MIHKYSIDHVALVARDAEAVAQHYKNMLSATEITRDDIPEQGVFVILLQVGDSKLEIITPTVDDSGVARFLDKRGEGFHHVAYTVEDIELELARLESEGYRLIDSKPRKGIGGHLVAFIHPESTHGVLIELVQHVDEVSN